MKALLIGFIAPIAYYAIKSDTTVIDKMITSAVSWCFEQTYLEYQANEKSIKQISSCNPEIVHKLLGTNHEKIMATCAELESLRSIEDNQYTTFTLLKQRFKSFIYLEDKEFKQKYEKFKENKKKLEDMNNLYITEFKEKFKKIIAVLTTNEEEKNVAKHLSSNINNKVYKNDFCYTLNKCNLISPTDRFKIIFVTGIDALKCAASAQVNDNLWYALNGVVENIFKNLGMTMVTTIAANALPGVMVPMIIQFIIQNWSIMKKFVDSFFTVKSLQEDNLNAEKDLYLTIGRLLGTIFLKVIGLQKRRLKKIRKYKL